MYYYFYEGSRNLILKARTGSKGLSTLESMLAGLIAGSATTVISNPIWVVQTTQAVCSLPPSGDGDSVTSEAPTAPAAPAPRVLVRALALVLALARGALEEQVEVGRRGGREGEGGRRGVPRAHDALEAHVPVRLR